MDSTVLSSLISAAAGLFGTFIGSRLILLSQKKTSQLQSDLAEKQIKNSFQLAAMDKRLETHQKAYVMWTKMRTSMFEPVEVRRAVCDEAIAFWNSHCLYLEHEVGKQFLNCVGNFYEYEFNSSRLYEYERNTKEHENARLELKKTYEQVKNTGKCIMEGAKYPFIETKQFSNEEKKEIEKFEKV